MAGDKVLGGGRPVRQGQVQEFRVGALKDTGVGVELWYGFIRGPVVQAGKGGGVLLRLELRPHNRHKCFFGDPACLHNKQVCNNGAVSLQYLSCFLGEHHAVEGAEGATTLRQELWIAVLTLVAVCSISMHAKARMV